MASHNVSRTVQPRTEEHRLQDLRKIEQYKKLEDQFRHQASRKSFDSDTFQLTSKLLRQNPEYYTVWNARRRCLTSGLLSRPSAGSSPLMVLQSSSANDTRTTSSAGSLASSSMQTQPSPSFQTVGKAGTTASPGWESRAGSEEVLRQELNFTLPLLMQFPKCYWIWSYRIWILQQVIECLDTPIARGIWQEELALVTKMLHKDRRNFHAWTYRRHVVQNLESVHLAGRSLVESEFTYTTQKIREDLSNFSAWHNRSKLIPRLLTQRKSDSSQRRAFFQTELDLVKEGLDVGPEDQSLWYYHQYLISNLVDCQDPSCFVPDLSDGERTGYIRREIEDMKGLLEDYPDVKWIYEALLGGTTAVAKLERRELEDVEQEETNSWLSKLKELDPQRHGRWNDVKLSAAP